MVRGGIEWMYRPPMPTFWRALTDNDRGNGFAFRSGMWLAADYFPSPIGVMVWVDGMERAIPIAPENNRYSDQECADSVRIAFRYRTITVPYTEVLVNYEVSSDGAICVDMHYFGKRGLPELPVFGMRFIMPTKAVSYCYEGLSGETYPDRMAGGKPGIYEVEGLPVTRYLVPQECGLHMQTKWLEVRRNMALSNEKRELTTPSCLRFEMTDSPFAFSCLPYTAQELENATHHEELPPARRTVVSILGAVRGVGGIDSWGADVGEEYHISGEEDIIYSFRIV